MIDLYLISVIAFVAILGILIYRDRKNIEFKYIVIMRKTQSGKKLIDDFAKLSPMFWKVFSTIGIGIAVLGMLLAFFLISSLALKIMEGFIKVPAYGFVLPLPSAQPSIGPGYILVPFWFWIILLPFILIPHEFSHAVIARVEKMRIKYVGLFLLLFLPGAFVEPNERDMKKASLLSKLRVVSIGSVTNFVWVLALFCLVYFIVWPFSINSGVTVTKVYENAPAYKAGLREGMMLQEFNSKKIENNFLYFFAVYEKSLLIDRNVSIDHIKLVNSYLLVNQVGFELEKLKPHDMIGVKADNKYYDLTLDENPKNSTLPYVGFEVRGFIDANDFSLVTLFPLIWWLVYVPGFVALINLLPIYPLDGGVIVESLADKFVRKKKKLIVTLITVLTISIFIFDYIGPLIV